MSKLRDRLLTVLTLTAVTVQAQNVAPRGTTRLESGAMPLLHGSAAAYPEAARRGGIEGTVAVEATLDAKGHVVDARAVTGPTELRAAALKSILDDHFAPDGSTRRTIQVSVVFTLQKAASSTGGLLPEFFNPPLPVLATECPMVPAELCRNARQRLTPGIGSTLTPEKMAELQKTLVDLDDHLTLNPRKISNGFVLDIWLRYETASEVPAGLVGGLAGGFPVTPPPPPPPPPKRANPEMASAPQRIMVGENVQQAKLVRQPAPVYPPLARQARIQGVVIFSAIIAKDGTVQDLQTVSGHPLLVPAALEAVKQRQYQTTSVNGEPVEVSTRISVNFTLAQQ